MLHSIKFRFKFDSDELSLGYIPWPRQIRRISLDDDIVEVFERGGTRATFSLDDVTLEDLFHDSEKEDQP